jgi:hypothetical protein
MPDVLDRFAASGVEFESVSLSVVLPSDLTLIVVKGCAIATQGATRVTLTLTIDRLSIDISPGLVVHTPWIWPPCSNTIISGIVYSFGENYMLEGTLAMITSDSSYFGFSAQSDVRAGIAAWFNDLTRGTRLVTKGYNPLFDTDPMGLLSELQTKVVSTRSGMPDLTGLELKAHVKTLDAISKISGDAGAEIPGGTDVTLTLELSGTAADVKAAKVKVQSARVDCDGIYILLKGERVARIRSATAYYGCRVRLNSCEILSEKIKDDINTGNSVGDLLVDAFKLALVAASGATRDEVVIAQAAGKLNLSPSDLKLGQALLEGKLSEALRDLYTQNMAALQAMFPPGVNLDDIFGASCRNAP